MLYRRDRDTMVRASLGGVGFGKGVHVRLPCFLRVRRHLPYVSVISESPDLSVEATAC